MKSKIGLREDCFGYMNSKKSNECEALNRLYCLEEDCKFYKSLAKYKEDSKNQLSVSRYKIKYNK